MGIVNVHCLSFNERDNMKNLTFSTPRGIIKGRYAVLSTIADTYNFSDEEFNSIIKMEVGETKVIGSIVITRNPDEWPLEPKIECGEAGHTEGKCGNKSCL